MTNEKVTSLSRIFGAIGSAFLLVAALAVPGNASAASTVTVDGIMSSGEYTGNDTKTSSGVESLHWWNDHHSIYIEGGPQENDLFWEITETSTDVYSVNIFVEVPTDARRMIWVSGCDWDGAGSDSDCDPIPDDILQAYLDGSHHDSVKMDYETQTGSEYFELNGIGVSIDWQAEDGNGLSDGFTWATSREYLIDTGTCTTSLCLEFDTTSSLELMWTGLTLAQAEEKVGDISDMQLHLSDEAVGLGDVPAVPVPAAIWLFGTALIGFIGISRRTNLS